MVATRVRKKPLASKNPKGAPNCGHMAAEARLPSSAVSEASKAAPDHSPPKPKPWQKRIRANRAGAMMPAVWYVGRTPMMKVAMPIVRSAPTRVALRPMRSPKCPKSTEPSGRAMKARPKVAKDWSRATVGSSVFGKKRKGKTATAAVA